MGIEEFLLDRARKEGVDQEKRFFVARLLAKTSLTVEQIADIVGVPVAFVEQIRNDPPPTAH